MLSERDIELAHPEAFDFVWGNLPTASRADFNRHLLGCRHCQAIVDEYSDIGRIIKNLPPHVEPSAELEERTVAAMVTALADQRDRSDRRSDTQDRTATAVHQIPQGPPPPEEPAPARVVPIPPKPPELAHEEPPTGTGARIIRFPRWHGHARLLAVAGAVAAAVITAAIVILPRLGGSSTTGGAIFALHSPTGQAASGVATDRPDASGSWDLTLSVAHLKNPGETYVYQCWYVGPGQPGHQKLVSAGTFVVGNDGSGTFSMTSGADPHDFRTMEITIEPLGHTGRPGPVVLTGTAHLT